MSSDKYLSIHYNDDFIRMLNERSHAYLPFFELAGTLKPWELKPNAFEAMQLRIQRFEAKLHKDFSGDYSNCILSEKGIYWLNDEAMEYFLSEFKEYVNDSPNYVPIPLWKLSVAEMLSCQVKNLRLLIVSAVRDMNLIERMKPALNGDFTEHKRNFIRFEKSLQLMLSQFSSITPTLPKVLNRSVDFYDRADITKRMFEVNEIDEEGMGYGQIELSTAQSKIEKRLKRMNPAFVFQLKSVKNVLSEEMHDCESMHLHRTSQWELILGPLADKDQNIRRELAIHQMEKDIYAQVVVERERETGKTRNGQAALAMSDKADQARQAGYYVVHEHETPVTTDAPDLEEKEEVKSETALDLPELKRPRPKASSRMVFMKRRRSVR